MAKANNDGLLQDITKMMTDPQAASDDTKITEIMDRIRDLDTTKASDQVRLAACHFMTMYHTRKAMTIGMNEQGGPAGGPPGPGGPMGGPMGGPPALGAGGPPLGGPPPAGGAGGPLDATGAGGAPTDMVNYEAVEKFKEDQRKDMLLGWNLLDIKGSNSQAARTARVLRIEVAQRLEDSEKLKEAFDDLMKRTLSEEEVMVAFTAAPFLGDWKAMMRLGRKIEKMPGGLEQLHMMSLQLPIPDFTVVYDLAQQHALEKKKAPDASTLPWDLLNVSKIRVKFKDVNCGQFAEKREELLAEIKKQGDIEWEDVPSVSHVHVKRMGALCQAVSFGEIPMMLNGPWLADKIHVKGRAEMPLMPEDQGAMMNNPYAMPDPSQMTILIQEEEWDLTRDDKDEKLYKGKYTLNQRPQLPPSKKVTPEHAPVNMEFECEVYLGESKNGDKAIGANANGGANGDKADEKNDDDEQVEQVVTEFDGLELD